MPNKFIDVSKISAYNEYVSSFLYFSIPAQNFLISNNDILITALNGVHNDLGVDLVPIKNFLILGIWVMSHCAKVHRVSKSYLVNWQLASVGVGCTFSLPNVKHF